MIEIEENKGVIYEFGKFVLDPQERVLLADGKPVHLSDKIFDTLLLLVERNGRLLTKDEMMTTLWHESFVEESNLVKNISRLRKILSIDGVSLIETLPKHGYRFSAEVTEIDGDTNLLVHRRTRVKFSQTTEIGGDVEGLNDPDLLAGAIRYPRAKNIWLFGGLILLLLTGIFFIYNFPISNRPVRSGGLTNLTNNVAEDTLPAWSPDGKKIAFTSNRDGAGDIYVMGADGSRITRLTFTQERESSPVWSPDGAKIVFDSERDGNKEIYAMNADGSGQTRLTFNPTTDAGPVSFSPDGKQVVFSRNAANDGKTAYNYDIYTMNADGTDVKQLTFDPEFDAEPIWSPLGKRILFISARDGNFEIYAIDPDGSSEVNVTKSSSASESAFAFTEDGRQIFCFGDSPERIDFNQIYLINADGTNRRQITSFADKVHRVAYSAKAGKFAISNKEEGNFEIYLMDALSP